MSDKLKTIRINEQVHTLLRIGAAQAGRTIADYLHALLKDGLKARGNTYKAGKITK